MSLFGLNRQITYSTGVSVCHDCGDLVVTVTISKLVVESLGVWQTSSLVLHRDEADAFGSSIRDAITLAELESGLES